MRGHLAILGFQKMTAQLSQINYKTEQLTDWLMWPSEHVYSMDTTSSPD